MVEEYLEGPQISTESILLDGIGYTPGFVDRNYEYLERFAPNIIENGGQQPSHLSAEEKHSVACLAEEAGRALGVTNGVVKGDMVLTKEGPKVIEIATRLSGGWFSTDQIPLATGVNFIGCAIRLALGENIDQSELVPRFQKGVAIRYFFPTPGKVKSIKNAEKYRKISWVYKLHFFVDQGDVVEATTNHTKRAGFVITVGETRDEAVARAETVIKDVMVETV
jgi:biotin carboxylase